MGYNNREIEYKFITGMTALKANLLVKEVLNVEGTPSLRGIDVDHFWKSPNPLTGDFIRLREGARQLTVKHIDKGTVTDRVEIDVPLESEEAVSQAHLFMDQVFGSSVMTLTKDYSVYEVQDRLSDNKTEVSVYQVRGSEDVFIEIESTNLIMLDRIEAILLSKVPSMKKQTKSLYQLFMEKKNAGTYKEPFREY